MLLPLFCFILLEIGTIVTAGLEVTPMKPEITYKNPAYLDQFDIVVRKLHRHSPYYINVTINTKIGFGNNVTANLLVLENLSGRYNPTMVRLEYKLCDWLEHDDFLGQLWAKLLPENATCPFRPQKMVIKNAYIDLERFKYIIPFTWSEIKVMIRMDVRVFDTTTKERIVEFNMHFSVTQKASTKGSRPKSIL